MAATLRAVVLGVLCTTFFPCAQAQQAAASTSEPAPDKPYVLHVYTDLLQIPALVMDQSGNPRPALTPADFELRLDSGPPFHPTALQVEGAEPLDLALVVDATGAEKRLLQAIGQLPREGVPGILSANDRISLYAFDCSIVRTLHDVPADTGKAHGALAQALASDTLHRPNAPKKRCRDARHLWDAVGAATMDVAKLPGRRAVLVLSDGQDDASSSTWRDLVNYAVDKSVAIFALQEQANANSGFLGRIPAAGAERPEQLLPLLAALSGGIVLRASPDDVGERLDAFVALLRSRYILQFPRPLNDTGGNHRLSIHVTHQDFVVRAAGIGVPVRDASLASDPTTVPADTSRLPVLGKRKPLN